MPPHSALFFFGMYSSHLYHTTEQLNIFSIAPSCQVLCYFMGNLLSHALRDSTVQMKE